MLKPTAKPQVSHAREALLAAAAAQDPISLEGVLDGAALQTRVDRKFLLTPEELTAFVELLQGKFKIMEIDGQRVFDYESTYFDTPDFEQYRAHRQGRRRRYKVRSRTYVDTGLCMFEIKTKGLRGATVKHRRQQCPTLAGELTEENDRFLVDVLQSEYGQSVPALQPVLDSAYSRATFADPVDGERVTCDVDLHYWDRLEQVTDSRAGRRDARGPELIVVETKTVDGRGISDQALAELGIREESMSKYCLGVAMLNPHLPANRWSRLLRRHFTAQL